MSVRREAPGALALSATVFLSGAALLGVEIAASRVLAPAFGSSLFVWGSLIGVVLAGLAVGYWVGGVLCDRFPTPYLLIGTLAAGAGLVLLVPVIDGGVVDLVTGWDPGPRLNPLVASVMLFGPLAIVLAAATPIAVRLAAQSLERLGRTAGRLFSVSTAGSIAGTFVTAFWLVPELGTDQVMAVGSVTLLAAAAGFALSQRLLPAVAVLVACVAGASLMLTSLAPEESARVQAASLQNWSPLYREREQRAPGELSDDLVTAEGLIYDVREAQDTRYHRMYVLDAPDTRYLRFDNTFQSAMSLKNPYDGAFQYTDYLQLGLAYNPSVKKVLFIGLGGGSVVKRMWRDFPQLELHAVEIDPEVVRVARQWFELPDDPRITVAAEDGRRFLAASDERYDMIVIDAYFSDSIPFHLATAQFFELVRSRLTPGGVVVSNVIGAIEGEGSKLLRSMNKTYRSVFPTVALHPVGGGGSLGNVIMIASEGGLPAKDVLAQNWQSATARTKAPVDLAGAIDARWEQAVPFADVPLLTDGYAPTDALLVG
jgi:spermidine synthase